jgi:hypothetical protein
MFIVEVGPNLLLTQLNKTWTACCKHSRFLFGRCLVRLPDGTVDILTEIFHSFAQHLQANVWRAPCCAWTFQFVLSFQPFNLSNGEKFCKSNLNLNGFFSLRKSCYNYIWRLVKTSLFAISQILTQRTPILWAENPRNTLKIMSFTKAAVRTSNPTKYYVSLCQFPWTGDQPVARPIPTQNNTNTINAETSLPRVGFEPTIPVFDLVKTTKHISVYCSTALVELSRFLQFLNPYSVCRTTWIGDQPVARPLPKHSTAQRRTNIHALHRAATVIGLTLPT